MKVEALQEKLKIAVSKAERVTGKHLSLPILSCIKLTAKDALLTVEATNLEIGIVISIPVKVIKEGTVAVPGGVLASFLASLPEDKNLTIESTGETLSVKTNHVSTTIKAFPSDDFPSIPRIAEGTKVTIPITSLIKGFRSTAWSASISSIKPELTSVSMRGDGESIVFVATDSFRLAEKRITTNKGIEFDEVLLPNKTVNDVSRILDGEKGDVILAIGENQCTFSLEGLYVVSRTIDATFPNYGQIIPKESKTVMTALKADLLQAFRLSTIFADSFNQVNFKVDPKGKSCVITTRNADVGESSFSIDAALEGDKIEMNFNYRYINDVFQALDVDSVSFSWSGAGKALVIRGVGDAGFLYLVMPMNR